GGTGGACPVRRNVAGNGRDGGEAVFRRVCAAAERRRTFRQRGAEPPSAEGPDERLAVVRVQHVGARADGRAAGGGFRSAAGVLSSAAVWAAVAGARPGRRVPAADRRF